MDGIEELYRLYAAPVFWLSYGLLHDRDAAMDVTQTVFLRAIRHAKTLDSLRDYQKKAWLMSAAKNASIDLMRKYRRERVTEEPVPADTAADFSALPEAEALSAEQRREVASMVDALPEAYRQPVMLYYFAEQSQREIAQTLCMNESTLRSRLFRAKSMLLEAMQGGNPHG